MDEVPRPKRFALAVWAAVGIWSSAAASAVAQQTRRFEVSVGGRPAGTYHITYEQDDKGTLTIRQKASVRFAILGLLTYSYALEGVERWRGEQLQDWEASADDDGTRWTVRGRREGDQFRVVVNGREKMLPAGFVLTSYALWPRAVREAQKLAVVESDTAKELRSTATVVGQENRRAAGEVIGCTHIRLRGGVHADLWYDAEWRLVHQESLESGHRTVLRLVAIDR
ncbi:MAG: DUF6134 family protein [Gemmataceae bacterium]|nr:DUF6134 family protein [Gemmataceae bacterium]